MREFVEQLDDGTMPGNPNLTRDDEQVMTAGNIARRHPEQIHSIWNVGKDISMSLHTYGWHINYAAAPSSRRAPAGVVLAKASWGRNYI